MKNYSMYFLGICILLAAGIVSLLHAQSYGAAGIAPIAPTVASCPAGAATFAYLCPVGSGTSYQMYVSYNGGAYAPLVGAAGGVTSWNGRTGAVMPAANDYSFAQLSSPPTSFSPTTGTLTGTIK